jgi:pantetheine-phosphate adenylyltransferase
LISIKHGGRGLHLGRQSSLAVSLAARLEGWRRAATRPGPLEQIELRVGLYSGSFDPVTYGHVDIVRRSAHLVDKLVIAVGTHHDKHPLFSAEERVKLTRAVLSPVAKEVGLALEVTTYGNLTVDAARDAGATVVIRGLRDAGDFDYEMQMAGMNQALAPEIETVFLASSPESRHIAASLVRQIAAMGGDVSSFAPKEVAAALKKKFAG